MLGFPLELILEVFQKSVVEVLTTQVGVTSSCLDGENTTSDVEKRDIESSSTQVEDEDVFLGFRLSVETVGNCGSCGLVDNTENIKTSDSTGIFGGQRCESLKYAGTLRNCWIFALKPLFISNDAYVTTAFFTVLPKLGFRNFLHFVRTMEEISWGLKVFSSPRYWTLIRGEIHPFLQPRRASGSCPGFIAAWFLAASPIKTLFSGKGNVGRSGAVSLCDR
jgi:hypothetical protein